MTSGSKLQFKIRKQLVLSDPRAEKQAKPHQKCRNMQSHRATNQEIIWEETLLTGIVQPLDLRP